MEANQRDIELIETLIVPLVGARGGQIKLSLNKQTGFKKKGMIEPWMIKKRNKAHFRKYIPYAEEKIATFYDMRFVKITRLIPSRGRIMDDDNFKGGCKQVRDILTEMRWIYDDDHNHSLFRYYQDKTRKSPIHSLEIKIGQIKRKKM